MKSVIMLVTPLIFIALLSPVSVYGEIDGSDKQSNQVNSAIVNEAKSNAFKLDDRFDHLMWFIQISDIHISIFHEQSRVHDFKTFATETLDAIKPAVVVASGDLTDAKDGNLIGSRQYEKEWKIYNEIVSEANVQNKTVWMDIRGNHDTFNVPMQMAHHNLFQKYSVQGNAHKRSYMKLVKGPSGEVYSFIAVDTSIEPGLKRPFNFFGFLTQSETDNIQQLLREAQSKGSNYTVWFGHYPTSCILTMNNNSISIRKLIADSNNGLAYLCGHLHDVVFKMYALQEDSFLELELADWKSNRMYRVAAIDHGLFSFVDVRHNEWPILLITNPKHALFYLPHRNEVNLQLKSTHIRILAFSPAGIETCTVQINNGADELCQKITEQLFVVKWNPDKYRNGMHKITATVVDRLGRQKMVEHPFKLNEDVTLSFNTMARFILKCDIRIVFICLFIFAWLLCVLPLVFFRVWHGLVIANKLNRKRISCRTPMSCVQQFWILASVDRIFWPIFAYMVYLAAGPWAICEVIDDHYGVVFLWGIYVDGTYMPGTLTYLYGSFQLLLCQFPVICILAKCVEKRYFNVIGMPLKKHRGSICSPRKLSQAPFYIIVGAEIGLAITFAYNYGMLAFLITPFRTWSIVLNLMLWYSVKRLPEHCMRSAVQVWNPVDRTINNASGM